jgi:two-component system alkaline phosphatase synthesis response regulator PhoP
MPQAQGDTVAYSLRKEGYRVLAYRDGEEAWQAFERSLPDLVILDILLPRLDGLGYRYTPDSPE